MGIGVGMGIRRRIRARVKGRNSGSGLGFGDVYAAKWEELWYSRIFGFSAMRTCMKDLGT